jgi:hypothetical protein
VAALATYGLEVVAAAVAIADDLAHGRVIGKELGDRHVSGNLTGFARVKFDGSGHRPRDESTREVSEVMRMPRTIKDILDHADELAKRFEDYEPSATDERDPAVFAELRRAVLSRSDAERSIRDAVKHARERGYSWAFIGSLVGTSGEAARQRYGHKQDA